MPIFFNILSLVLVLSIAALHIASLWYRCRVLNALSIILHIVALIPLLYFSAEFKLVLALYLMSLAIRTVLYTVIAKIKSKRGEG